MRDESLTDYDFALDDDAPGTGGGWKAVAGAGLSLCLLAGLVVWSYRLGVRDATDVPVIRAMVQDLRVAPDDPGGLQVAHQDRGVYALTGGAVRSGAETVMAPPPEALLPEDAAMARLAPDLAPAVDMVPEDEPAAPAQPASIDDLVAAVLAPGAGAAVSPLPPMRPRPGGAPAPLAEGSAPGAAVPPAPSPLAGQPAIQLGAYLTEDVARNQWRVLSARNGDLLAGRQPVVNAIVGPSRTLYGLRAAPFGTVAEAQGLCAALRARNEDCLVTELR